MPPLLTVEKLSKRFGGIQALDDLDLEVVAGTVHGLIGPNGSGKSTALHVMSGFLKSDRGTVTFADRALDGMSPHRRAGIGIGRVFQSPAIFPELTVAQNVLVGCHTIHREGHRLFNVLFRPRKLAPLEAELRDRCLESLATVGLAARADEAAANLSYGDRKLLDLAKALVVQPKLLLCDEPAAGLAPHAVARLKQLFELLRSGGTTIVVAEHNMKLMLSLCDRITVLNFGRKIAEGPPEAIRANRAVIEAYLGGAAK